MSVLIEIDATTPGHVHGYLAIDSLVDGQAHGGLRLSDDVSPELLAAAARTMTLKYGFVHLPVGGAKAGLVAAPDLPPEGRRMLLHSFGRALRPYLKNKTYVPGEDMGTTPEDVEEFMRGAGLRPLPRSLTYVRSGLFTGIGVCASALAFIDVAGLGTTPITVAIEGFGNVGSSAAAEFHRRGARVVAVSTRKGAVFNEAGLNVERMVSERRTIGDEVVNASGLGAPVEPRTLASLGAHIFCPCAVMHSIDEGRAHEMTARVVCPGANVPYTADGERVMIERAIGYLPDFAANCGGVLGSSISRAGVSETRAMDIIRQRLEVETRSLFVSAREQGRPLAEVAKELAMRRFEREKAAYERPSPSRRLFRIAVGLHRRGLVPRLLLGRAAEYYFDR